jgi:hypothetical protein
MKGTGMGSVLLDKGGAGSGSSYTSIDDYLRTTQRGKKMGMGLGGAVQRKLESLAIKPSEQKFAKKKKNISTPFGISLHLWVRRCNTNWNSPSNGNNSLSGIYPFGWNLYRRNNASPRMKWDNF